MRKRIIWCANLLLFVLVIVACHNTGKVTTTNETTTIVTTTITTTTTIDETLITEGKTLTLRDLAPEYKVTKSSLKTYVYKNQPEVTYVNVVDFIDALEGILVDLQIEKTNTLKLTYIADVPIEYQEALGVPTYTYEMIIDADNDTIYFNDFDMIKSINIEPSTEYLTRLELKRVELNDVDSSITIDLKNYNMDIVKFKDEFYLPLYLTNLFLTGENIHVYEMGNELYVLDYTMDVNELTKRFKQEESLTIDDIKHHTENYLALYFDYFYGLKTFKNVTSYKEVLQEYKLSEATSFQELHQKIEKFIYDLNDLHTSIITAGYMDKDFKENQALNDKMTRFQKDYNDNICKNRRNEMVYEKYNNYQAVVLQINQFSLETRELMEIAKDIIKDYQHIVFDISCNPGGNLVGVLEVLTYLTNKEIPFTYSNPITGSTVIEYYQLTDQYLRNKAFYIYTSGVTYSAANLFVSIVQDLDLAYVIGKPSLGGASAVNYTVLPDGMILCTSGLMTLTNKEGVIIEDGIQVDRELKLPINWYSFFSELETQFRNSSIVEHKLNKTEVGKKQIEFTITRTREDLLNPIYTLKVINNRTHQTITSVQFTNKDNFSYTLPKIVTDDTLLLELSVKYTFNKVSFVEVIYLEEVD